jgi:hypothetical protein
MPVTGLEGGMMIFGATSKLPTPPKPLALTTKNLDGRPSGLMGLLPPPNARGRPRSARNSPRSGQSLQPHFDLATPRSVHSLSA